MGALLYLETMYEMFAVEEVFMDRQWLRKRCCRQALAAFTLGGTLLFSSSAGAAALSLNEAIDYALAKNTGLRITREGERGRCSTQAGAREKQCLGGRKR